MDEVYLPASMKEAGRSAILSSKKSRTVGGNGMKLSPNQQIASNLSKLGFDYPDCLQAAESAGKRTLEMSALQTLFEWYDIDWTQFNVLGTETGGQAIQAMAADEMRRASTYGGEGAFKKVDDTSINIRVCVGSSASSSTQSGSGADAASFSEWLLSNNVRYNISSTTACTLIDKIERMEATMGSFEKVVSLLSSEEALQKHLGLNRENAKHVLAALSAGQQEEASGHALSITLRFFSQSALPWSKTARKSRFPLEPPLIVADYGSHAMDISDASKLRLLGALAHECKKQILSSKHRINLISLIQFVERKALALVPEFQVLLMMMEDAQKTDDGNWRRAETRELHFCGLGSSNMR